MRFPAFIAIVACLFLSESVHAQRIRFPQTPPNTISPASAGTVVPGPVAQGGAVPNGGILAPQSGAALGNPSLAPGATYDPFAPGGAAMPGAPSPYANPYPGAVYPNGNPGMAYPGPAYPGPGYPGAGYPPPLYQGAPYQGMQPPPYGAQPYQPQGIVGNDYFASPYYRSSQDFLNQFERGRYLRVIQEFHYRHTWLEGSENNEVDIHDAEIGMTLNWPNFLGSGEPLQISPTFIFHFWDGPQPPSTADLPAQAYSAFFAGSWTTPKNANFGGEIVTSFGVYSDFSTLTSHSWRIKGTGLGWVRFTPNMLFKLGVSYYDRLDIKLLPVGGLYWKPSGNTELELYFPNPKIKFQLPQVGNTEFNAYLTANYGGDAWTVSRDGGFSDQVDLVDYRILGGVEFIGFRGVRGFFEAGYAFNRRLLYRVTPAESIKLSDSVILRAGFLF